MSMRDEFEEWATRETEWSLDLSHLDADDYADNEPSAAWAAWQAVRAGGGQETVGVIAGETLYIRVTKDLSGGPDETFVEIEDGDGNSVRIERIKDGNDWLIGPLYEAPKEFTTPGNADTGEAWKPYYEYPEMGQPVLGYHRDWVDEDVCKDGVRECFTFGDGSEWQSARWDGYSDQWIVEDGAPEFWHSHPTPPTAQGGEGDE